MATSSFPHFFIALPTLFFTLFTYAIHEVTHITANPSRREIEAEISVARICEVNERKTKR